MFRMLIAACSLGVAADPIVSSAPDKPPRISLADYSFWRAEIRGFDICVSRSPLTNLRAANLVDSYCEFPSFRAECNWAKARWDRGYAGVGLLPHTPRLPFSHLPLDVDPQSAWQLCCGTSSDGCYALLCTGWWPIQSHFRLLDMRTQRPISEQLLPFADPMSFSGFVIDEKVLGFCTTIKPDSHSAESVVLQGGLTSLSQLGNVFAIPKSGDWYSLEILDVRRMKASPSGKATLLRRGMNSKDILEVRTARLDRTLWSKEFSHTPLVEFAHGLTTGIWSSDEKIIAIVQDVGSPQQEDLELSYFDAQNGELLGQSKTTQQFLSNCVILMAPVDELQVLEEELSLEVVRSEYERQTSEFSRRTKKYTNEHSTGQ